MRPCTSPEPTTENVLALREAALDGAPEGVCTHCVAAALGLVALEEFLELTDKATTAAFAIEQAEQSGDGALLERRREEFDAYSFGAEERFLTAYRQWALLADVIHQLNIRSVPSQLSVRASRVRPVH